MEKEEPEAKPVASTASGAGLFASHSATFSSAAPAQPQPADTVWQRVVYGNEDGVLQMIQTTPRLVEERTTVVDYSGRTVDNATPFQMALRAGDEIMAKKIKAIYLQYDHDNGQTLLDAQFNEVFPLGYAAHLQEQKVSADTFERDHLNPLVEAISNASPADLQAALDKRDNGSALVQALNAFKAAFADLSLREKVFNPNHLLKAFEKYDAKFDAWYVNGDNPCRWLRLDLFWRQVTGWEERYMTANYAQSFCTGLSNIVDGGQPLRRTLILYNCDTNRDINFFPLDAERSSRLGAEFACEVWGANGVARGCGTLRRVAAFTKLMSSKNSKLGGIMQPESNRRAAPGCLVQ